MMRVLRLLVEMATNREAYAACISSVIRYTFEGPRRRRVPVIPGRAAQDRIDTPLIVVCRSGRSIPLPYAHSLSF